MSARPALSGLRGLYAIVDPEQLLGREPVAVAQSILRGGCAVLQLRAKKLGDAEALALARSLRALCAEAEVPFVMNDRVDLALLSHAEGVHLGQDDLPLACARALLGARFIVGRSTHDLAQVEAEAEADILGFGPIYTTTTKENAEPVVGLERLREALVRAKPPLVAIGGITRARLPEVVATGVPLVAMISAITRAEDVEAEARAAHALIRAQA